MAESVDAADLKSDKPKGLCGFNSRSEYERETPVRSGSHRRFSFFWQSYASRPSPPFMVRHVFLPLRDSEGVLSRFERRSVKDDFLGGTVEKRPCRDRVARTLEGQRENTSKPISL